MRNQGGNIILILLIIGFCFTILACAETPHTASNSSNATAAPKSDSKPRPQEVKSPSAAEPKIISREVWQAKNAVGSMQTHKPSRITIHHTASLQKSISIEQKMRDLQAFSQTASKLSTGKLKPAWPDVPYHFYIAADGQIAEGRKVEYVGDTNTEYNPTGHILVTLEGNFETEQPSQQQLTSLHALVFWLAKRFDVPVSSVRGHNDYAKTACPGKNLSPEIPKLRESLARAADAR